MEQESGSSVLMEMQGIPGMGSWTSVAPLPSLPPSKDEGDADEADGGDDDGGGGGGVDSSSKMPSKMESRVT